MDSCARCQQCNASLTGQAVGGLCAICLLKLALEPPVEATLEEDGWIPSSGEPIKIRYFGDYELLEEIARGGMGVVYKARQVSLNRTVALKMILAGNFSSPAMVARFQTEAEAEARLEHPNIVPIHEIGSHEGQHYFSMRFMEGGTLARVMARQRHGLREAAELIAKVARAVHHAHQRGILHRDLKPGNILLDQAGNPHVADFGLAKLLEQDGDWSQSAMALGTPSYMAPEQASGQTKQLSTAVDVYSLGAILYELLTGCVPFRGATPAETIRRVMDVIPRRPHLLNPGVDRDLETVCLKCLEKDPQRRYGSANGLANDLERWRRGEPITARAVSTREHIWKWLHRRPPIFFAMASAIVVCLVGGLAGILVQWKRAERADGLTQQLQAALLELGKAREAEKTAREEADRANYFRNITWAQRDWEANNVARAEQLLDECAVELRGFEWRYLKRLCHSDLLTLRHSHPLKCVAFNRDGQYVAAGGAAGTIVVWSPMTGDEIGRFETPFPGDMGAEKGKNVEPVTAVAFHPVSDRIVSATGQFLHIWSLETGKPLHTLVGHSDTVLALAISADGQWLASGSRDKTIRIWNAATGELLRTLDGHTEAVSSLAFSPDGTRVLSGSGEIRVENNRQVESPGEVKIWEVGSGQLISTLGSHLIVVTSVAYSFDGCHLAAGDSNGRFRLWEAGTFQQRADLNLHSGGVSSLAFSKDNRRLISGSADQTIKVWDMEKRGELFACRGHDKRVNGISLSPDGKLVASVSDDNTLKLWDASTGPGFKSFKSLGRGLAFSPNGILLAVIDTDSVEVWRMPGGKPVLHEVVTRSPLYARGVAFSPDGRYFASIVTGGVKIWNTDTWQAIHTFSETRWIYGLAFSPDGRHVAVCGGSKGSGLVRIWEVGSGTETQNLTGLANTVWSIAFGPDGSQLAAALGYEGTSQSPNISPSPGLGNVLLFDIGTGAVVHTFSGHKCCVWDVAFSPDGKTLASTSGYYGLSTEAAEVKLWDVAAGQELRTLSNKETCVFSICFSADGKRLATSAGFFKEQKPVPIYLWDVSTGREVLTLTGHARTVLGVTFSPNGACLASASTDGTVRVWDAGEVTPENQAARRAGVVGREAMERARQRSR